MKTWNSTEKIAFKQRHPKKKAKSWEAWTKFGTTICIDQNINRGILVAEYGDSANYKGIY